MKLSALASPAKAWFTPGVLGNQSQGRKARARRIGAWLLVLVGIVFLTIDPGDREALRQDQRTAEWVERALQERSRTEAFEAALRSGARAVPWIARQGLHDPCHRLRFLSHSCLQTLSVGHPRLNRWLRLDTFANNCVGRHAQAQWLLSCLGTNAQAAIPDVIDCLKRCPQLHYIHTTDLLDTLGIISGTNPTAIPFLTRLARQDLNLRAAAVAYYIDGQTNLLVETCHRLAEANPGDLLAGQELYWFRDDQALNQHLIPLLERLYADPRSGARERQSILGELESRGSAATGALSRLRTRASSKASESAGPTEL